MIEKREIIGHAYHKAQGPHLELPSGFVPLRLCLQAKGLHIEVICPIAIIGRHSDADMCFAYPEVSRRHCRLAFENGQWRVYDLKSLNGTYVNNIPVAESTLYGGDELRISCVRLLVKSATPLSKAEENQHEKLRQIAEVLPSMDTLPEEPRTK